MERVPAISVDRSVVIAGKMFQTESRCGYRTLVCHMASRPDSGDLVVVLPDDFTQTEELNPTSGNHGPIFCCQPRPLTPRWLYPYASALQVVSPIFSQSRLPDSWLKASVSVWQPARLLETWVECPQSISVNEPPTLQSSQRRQ